MGTGSEELRLPIGIPVETNAKGASDEIRSLRDSIASSKDAIKESATALRNLRGNTDEVKAAKDQLRAKLREEEAAVTAATLKLVKQGGVYDDTAKKAKAAAEVEKKSADQKKAQEAAAKKSHEAAKKQADESKAGADAMGKAIGAAGGPVASLKGKLDSMNDVLGGSSGGMAAMAGVAAIAAAAVLAVGAAAVSAAYSIGKFIVVSADAERMMQLTRKANLAGRNDWATNLRDQVDAIAREIPLAKDKINELGVSLAKSRIGGQTMIDTMKAVGGATAAAGDDLGNKLKGIVERGALSRRFQLSPQELMGMDLDFTDVAKAYADGMHISVEAARKALFEGRVKLSDGAAALKKAVESKFGGINADKMLGLDNQARKLTEDLAALAKDVDMKPLLEGIKKLSTNFDQSSVNGKALKGIVTTIGNSIGIAFKDGVPAMQDFIDKAVYGALKIENYWLRAKLAFEGTGAKVSLEYRLVKGALAGMVDSFTGFLGVIFPVAGVIKGIYAAIDLAKASFDNFCDSVTIVKDAFTSVDWSGLGKDIIDGLIHGLELGASLLKKSVTGLADGVKYAFKDVLGIQSPSKVFEEFGRQTTAGYEKGIDDTAPDARAATAGMASVPSGSSSGSSGASSSSRGPVQITFAPNIVVQGGGGDIAEQLKDPALLQPLTEQFLMMLRAAGFEVAA